MQKQKVPRYRILNNLSYIPRNPHGLYRIQGIPGYHVAYSSHPRENPDRNSANLHIRYTMGDKSVRTMYEIQHKQIASKQHEFNMLKKTGKTKLTKQDAVEIWSFVKAMTRNILDRTHELLLSEISYIRTHEQALVNYFTLNCGMNINTFERTFGKFERRVGTHLHPITKQTEFLLKHIRYYRNAILDIMKIRIQVRKTYLKISKYITQYFSNIQSIVQNINTNMVYIKNYTKYYVKTLNKYNAKYCINQGQQGRRRVRIPSESEKAKDRKNVMKAFYKLKINTDKDFKKLLELMRRRQRNETSVEMELYKKIISRSNQRLPL